MKPGNHAAQPRRASASAAGLPSIMTYQAYQHPLQLWRAAPYSAVPPIVSLLYMIVLLYLGRTTLLPSPLVRSYDDMSYYQSYSLLIPLAHMLHITLDFINIHLYLEIAVILLVIIACISASVFLCACVGLSRLSSTSGIAISREDSLDWSYDL